MVLGNGLIAQAFSKVWANDPGVVVVAAGVSNSSEIRASEFSREHRMLSEVLAGSMERVVYFSSCAAGNPFEPRTAYLTHKEKMEQFVLSDPRGLVLRLPQVVGRGGNQHTLTNFLARKISSGEQFEVWAEAERNLIDVEDVAIIGAQAIRCADRLPRIVSIADLRSTDMLTIVRAMEDVLGKPGRYTILQKGTSFPIEVSTCAQLAKACGVSLGEGYLRRVIERYYAN